MGDLEDEKVTVELGEDCVSCVLCLFVSQNVLKTNGCSIEESHQSN